MTKKEILMLSREREKLERSLGGIKEMGGTPDLMVVIDTNKEAIAIQEAKRLNIPVVAVIDTNCDPDPVDFPIPGNDDAARAISLYCDLIARASLDGMSEAMGAAGVDLGEMRGAEPSKRSFRPPRRPAAKRRGRDPAAQSATPQRLKSPQPPRKIPNDSLFSGTASAPGQRQETRHGSFTAAQVKELRDATGAGMMDAKKALTENDGDIQSATDWLRTKGLAKAAKKADRVAAEGLVAVPLPMERPWPWRSELRNRLCGAQRVVSEDGR